MAACVLKKKNALYGKQKGVTLELKAKMNFWKLWEWYLPSLFLTWGALRKVGSQGKMSNTVSQWDSQLSWGAKLTQEHVTRSSYRNGSGKLTFWLEAGCSWTGSRANHNVLSRGTDSIRISDLMAKSNQLANKQTIVCVCWIHWHAFSSLTRPSASHLESNLAVPDFLHVGSKDVHIFPHLPQGDGERISAIINTKLFELLIKRCFWNTNYF